MFMQIHNAINIVTGTGSESMRPQPILGLLHSVASYDKLAEFSN